MFLAIFILFPSVVGWYDSTVAKAVNHRHGIATNGAFGRLNDQKPRMSGTVTKGVKFIPSIPCQLFTFKTVRSVRKKILSERLLFLLTNNTVRCTIYSPIK
jgi:hypothetical protein